MSGIFFHWQRKSTGRRWSGRSWGALGLCLGATLALLAASSNLHAQVKLPPTPSTEGLLGELDRDLSRLSDDPVKQLVTARRRLVAELLRRNPRELERDPRGEAIVRGELTAFAPSGAALLEAQAAGFTILREQPLPGLDSRLLVLRGPPGMSTWRALRRLRSLDPAGEYDFNHLYLPGGAVRPSPANSERADLPPSLESSLRVGLVDGGLDSSHPAFAGMAIHVHGCNGSVVPSDHGTAVASLLAGRDQAFRGAAPGATLYAADIYCRRATGGAVESLAEALAWMAGEGVAVINCSVVGPPNRILENVIRELIGRGHIIVAAVGNDGPAARPLFPASYPGVVGVTGIDARRRVLPEAARGPQVDFAAPGAAMLAAFAGSPYAEVRGTSFAAPLVAGLLAGRLQKADKEAAERAVAELAETAIDLGRRGRDTTYGAGLVAESLRVPP
jgi:hypothetical protein